MKNSMLYLRRQRWVYFLCLLVVFSGCTSSRVSILPGGKPVVDDRVSSGVDDAGNNQPNGRKNGEAADQLDDKPNAAQTDGAFDEIGKPTVSGTKIKWEKPHVLEFGDEAIITLIDGTQIKGTVTSISSTFVVMGITDNFGYSETRIESSTIETIEWTNSGSIWPLLLGITIAVVVYCAAQLSSYQ